MSKPLAHSGGHLLANHLQSVARTAAGFSQAFDMATAVHRWAYLEGLWHDLGKYSQEFQAYIKSAECLINPDEGDYIDAKQTFRIGYFGKSLLTVCCGQFQLSTKCRQISPVFRLDPNI